MTEVMNSLATRRSNRSNKTNPISPSARHQRDQFKLEPDRKLRREDVERIITDPRAHKQRELIYRLMEGPITLRTANGFLDLEKGDHLELIYRINHNFIQKTGKPAIHLLSLGGKSRPTGFWIMKLNAELFDLPQDYDKLVIGKDVKLADILNPIKRLILNYLSENPFKTLKQIQEAFPGRGNEIRTQIRYGRLNLSCETNGFPPALLHTKTWPRVWYINPAFATLFNIQVSKCKGSLEELFRSRHQKIIRCIAEYEKATAKDIGKALGPSSSFKVHRKIRYIEQRCEELGLPKPFEWFGTGRNTSYRLTEEFRRRFSLGVSIEHPEEHFTKKQIPVVKIIADKPWISGKEIQHALGITKSALHSRISTIKKTCNSNNLPKLKVKQVGSNSEIIYCWSKPFLKRLGFTEGKMEFARLLRGNIRLLYEYCLGKNVLYTKQICKDLGWIKTQLHNTRALLNKKLRENHMPELPRTSGAKARIDWEGVREVIVLNRMKHGKWPKLRELKKREYAIAMGVQHHLGGLKKP